MALLIQNGSNKYYAELWERTRLLMYKILQHECAAVPLPNYISHEDLEQELYFALITAVTAYKPEKQYKFNTYLNYSIKNTLRFILSANQKRIQEISYNQPTNEDEDSELIDFYEDTEATERITAVEEIDQYNILRQAINELVPEEKEIIIYRFFKGKTIKQLSEQTGCTYSRIRRLENKALIKLRRNKTLQKQYDT